MIGMPGSLRRDNAVFRTRQAAALAAVPEPGRVTAIAAEAAGLVQVTGSARLRKELMALPRHAAAWRNTPAGRQLRAIVTSVA
jgi:hypothetical protein